jgi:hypothetical protein
MNFNYTHLILNERLPYFFISIFIFLYVVLKYYYISFDKSNNYQEIDFNYLISYYQSYLINIYFMKKLFIQLVSFKGYYNFKYRFSIYDYLILNINILF